jgi:hypothetical protein
MSTNSSVAEGSCYHAFYDFSLQRNANEQRTKPDKHRMRYTGSRERRSMFDGSLKRWE